LSKILQCDILEKFGCLGITSPVHGLYSTKFPLWKLGYFLREEWLEDLVLDGLAEIQYFKAGDMLVPIGMSPRFLFLPTSFMNDAQLLYHQEDTHQYSPKLRALQE